MRFKICSIALLLVICCAGTLQAATFTVNLPCTGSYYAGEQYSTIIDLGQSFTSIQSVSVAWSGKIWGGLVPMPPYNSVPTNGRVIAAIWNDSNAISKQGTTPSLGAATYPSPASFDCTTALTPYLGNSSWDFLLDGKTRVTIDFSQILTIPENGMPIQPRYQLDSASLIVDGTPVPEPSSIVALLLGIGGVIPIIRRRR